MASAQMRSQKDKPSPTMTGRGASAAANAKRGNGEKQPNPAPGISADEREMLVARIAYFRAEKRGFAPGRESQDWAEAEAEVLLLTGCR